MHLKDVEIFCEVAARRSFSKAAEAHGLSQSTASHAVGSLEKRLGTLLIDRSKRPLELTGAGQVYFDGCRDLLASIRSVEDQVQQFSDRLSGRLCVTAIYSVGLLEVESAIDCFMQSHPDVDVRLEYRTPDGVYQSVLNNESHFGIVSFPRDGGDIDCIPWQSQKMVVAVGPDHRFATREEVSVAELAGERLVTFDSNLAARKQIDRWLRDADVEMTVLREFDNVETIKRSVEIGSGAAILPEPLLKREIASGSLAAVPLSDAHWYRPLGFIHRRNQALVIAAQRLIELLCSDDFVDIEPPAAVGVAG
ncbi:LysR family transcriptional regulator [Stratiformator vulcanicus]|uniref:Hydrogen peroxide-inducible genes activator n=1 Tax=Stratiformator vulcanicus TaxID=2527980 RepID=A0A517R6M3_9PLAN|nr:LysR family transcriptional regulator [Stratiformator vulcanicus]QDT39528.1 Hydrogen peroxide-inducible genes activator [Stratiformator vulcanicus]